MLSWIKGARENLEQVYVATRMTYKALDIYKKVYRMTLSFPNAHDAK